MHREWQRANGAPRGFGAHAVAARKLAAARKWLVPVALALLAWLAPAMALAQSPLPIYRFFNNQTGTHFYTISTIERDIVLSRWPQFLYEGPVFYAYPAPAPDTKPVYRFFDTATSTHFYTQSEAERDLFVATHKSYILEGVVYYAPSAPGPGRAALYRFFNTQTQARFYTDSTAERDIVLQIYPWFQLEGIGFYVLTSQSPAGATDDSALKVSLTVQPTSANVLAIQATTTDTVAFVTSVDFLMDGVPLGSLTREPWALSVTITPGTHVFTAVAHDTSGATRASEPASYTLSGPVVAKPKVTLAASSATVTLGQPVTLNATASEDGGTIAKVAFYTGTTLLFESTTAPYAYTYTPAAEGNYAYTAIAFDAKGVTTTSAAVGVHISTTTVPPPNVPKVTLAASASTLTLGQTVTLTASASETGGTISKVRFFAGATLLFESAAAPYTYTYTPAAEGDYAYSAVAVDAKGATATSSTVGLHVSSIATPPATTPKVTLAVTPNTVTLGSPVTFTATASETGGTIKSVSIYVGATLVKTISAPPYTTIYTPAATGLLAFTAIATDAAGVTGTSSSASVKVNPAPGATPKVSLSASSTSIAVGQTVTLTATASETGGTIRKVGFYSGTKLLQEQLTPPFVYQYTPAVGGALSFSAIATDTGGAQVQSQAIPVSVAAAPAVTLKVSLASTTTFTQVPATITLTANPTGSTGTITKVEFLRNGAVIGTVSVKPYTLATALATAGQTYQFTARATDSFGVVASSTILNVVTTPTPVARTTTADVWRLLTQATFGPTQADVASVQTMGVQGWIDSQFTQAVSGYPDARYNHIQLGGTFDCTNNDPAGNPYPANSPQVKCVRDHLSLNMIQRDFFTNAVGKPDQLRQRVAWALSQILVTSGNEPDLGYAYVMSRYQGILFANAFGNFETLLQQVTLSPAMGNYLDAVNNDRADGKGRVPNENYAREIMQLFSIGLEELKEDGTPLTDGLGNPIPTYDQDDIKEMARVFTGWTYATPDGLPAVKKNPAYYAKPMVTFPGTATTGHDSDAKTLVNDVDVPAGQNALQDMQGAVHAVFMHPNTPVFISKQLIQRLVTGNPSPAYVQRIVQVFKNNGAGVRGDLHAVVRAILLDSEARGSADKGDSFGSLREPALVITSMVRSLSGITDGNTLGDRAGALGQRPYYSPTVFNYFQPDTSVEVQGKSLVEPEFAIHDSNTAFARANLVYTLVYNGVGEDANLDGAIGTRLNIQQFEPFADDPATLVNQVNTVLLGGTLPATASSTIATAVAAIASSPDPTKTQWRTDRARAAVYLMASSYYFQVQH